MNKKELPYIIIKNVFITALVVFLAIYISLSTGVASYYPQKQAKITSEKIKQFEQDVKDGKNIVLENYVDSMEKVESNKASLIGTYLSKKITALTNSIINLTIKIFSLLFG